MSRISIILGIVLILVGGAAYGMTSPATWVALVPSMLGLAFVACAVLDLLSEVAGTILGFIVALVGLGTTFMHVMDLGALFAGTADQPAIIITSAITFVLLIAYGVFAIRSLVAAARMHRHSAAAA